MGSDYLRLSAPKVSRKAISKRLVNHLPFGSVAEGILFWYLIPPDGCQVDEGYRQLVVWNGDVLDTSCRMAYSFIMKLVVSPGVCVGQASKLVVTRT